MENITAAKQAAKLLNPTESKNLDPYIVDQIFEEFDAYTEEMIGYWKKEVTWSDYDELIVYLKLKHAAKRSAVLNKVVPDRICPECKEIEVRDSHWRVDKWHASAICWDCHRRNHNYRTINSKFYPGNDELEVMALMRQIFHSPQVRYKIDGENLSKMRGILGVTQKSLADAIGVTPMITHLYEEGRTRTITRERAVACMKLFKQYFMNRLKQLGYDVETKDWHENIQPEIEEID